MQLGRGPAIRERGFKFPVGSTFGRDLIRELLGFFNITGVECRAEKRGIQPRIIRVTKAGALACRERDRGRNTGLVVIASALAGAIQAGEVGRGIVVVEVELHAGFVFGNCPIEINGVLARIPLLFVAAAEEAAAFRAVAAGRDQFPQCTDRRVLVTGF